MIFVGAGADGRDLAGAVSALTGLGVLVNAIAVSWTDAGPSVEMSVFGGKLLTTSGFTGGRGIITVRPNVTTATPADDPRQGRSARLHDEGDASPRSASSSASARPAPRPRSRRPRSSSPAVAVSAARMASGSSSSSRRSSMAPSGRPAPPSIPAGSRTASRSGRPARSSNPTCTWRSASVARSSTRSGCGRPGAIVAVNRDADAPIAEFADLFVVGDLFEVGNALLEQLRARSG